MSKSSKSDIARLTGHLQTDQKLLQDVATGMMIEPGGVADAAFAMMKNASPFFWFGLQQRFAQEQIRILTSMVAPKAASPDGTGAGALVKPDPRFAAPEWEQYPWFRWLRDTYLSNSKLTMEAIERADLGPAQRQQLAFYTRLMVEAMSPANFELDR